jgi:hypothetical protein
VEVTQSAETEAFRGEFKRNESNERSYKIVR